MITTSRVLSMGKAASMLPFSVVPTYESGGRSFPNSMSAKMKPVNTSSKRFGIRLGCGIIKANHRGSRSDRTRVLVVRNRQDLSTKVIPFFLQYSLHTEKKNDFESFRQVVEMMNQEIHLSADGFTRIVELAYAMNANGSRRKILREEI